MPYAKVNLSDSFHFWVIVFIHTQMVRQTLVQKLPRIYNLSTKDFTPVARWVFELPQQTYSQTMTDGPSSSDRERHTQIDRLLADGFVQRLISNYNFGISRKPHQTSTQMGFYNHERNNSTTAIQSNWKIKHFLLIIREIRSLKHHNNTLITLTIPLYDGSYIFPQLLHRHRIIFFTVKRTDKDSMTDAHTIFVLFISKKKIFLTRFYIILYI